MHESADALATAVAGELLTRLTDAQTSGHEPQIALTGGTIADAVHRELARLAAGIGGGLVAGRRLVGRRAVRAPDSPDRNAAQAHRAFLDPVGADPPRCTRCPPPPTRPTSRRVRTPTPTTLRSHGSGAFDVLMLGVGPDGHVASLFPGFPQLDVDDRIAVAVTGSPKPPPERISLTFSALNRAKAVWFLVSGDEKAPAVARALADGTDLHDCPAAGVTGTEETIWFLDRAAASAL